MMYEPRMPISFKHFAKQGKSLEECLEFVKHTDDGTFEPLTKEEWLERMKRHYTTLFEDAKETLELLNRF
jgi:hypothetical protein